MAETTGRAWAQARLRGQQGQRGRRREAEAEAASSPAEGHGCTQIYVGSALTTTGDTFFGRTEDAANRDGKAFGVEPAHLRSAPLQSYENGNDPQASFSRRVSGPTLRYTFVRDLPSVYVTDPRLYGQIRAYSEAGTNELGVSVSATLTSSCNDSVAAVDPLVPTGIGEFSIADAVLCQSRSAREGVRRLGRIIDEQGSYDCNQVLIADAFEVWVFMQLSGHQWLALLAPSDGASVNPNADDLSFSVDLDDEGRCLHSASLVDVARRAGTYVQRGGRMDVAASYGKPSVAQGWGVGTRYVQGHLFLGDGLSQGVDYQLDDEGSVRWVANPQLFFAPAPGHKVSLTDALRALSCRGEGTPVDANANRRIYSIGNDRTTEAHLFQLRHGLSPDIATVQWTALSRAEFSVFIPSYSALLTQVDERLYPSPTSFDESHVGYRKEYEQGDGGRRRYLRERIEGNDLIALRDDAPGYLDYVMLDLNTLCYNHRDQVAGPVHEYLDALQREVIEQFDLIDLQMRDTAPGVMRETLANEAHRVISWQVYERTSTLLRQVRTHLLSCAGQQGHRPARLAIADLTPQGTLAEPLACAEELADFDVAQAASKLRDEQAQALGRQLADESRRTLARASLAMLAGGLIGAATGATLGWLATRSRS